MYAVQNRIFHKTNEIDLSVGYIADDDFYHVYPISVGYTWNINETWSWEVGRVAYMFNTDKDLKTTLEDKFEATPEKFPEQKYMWHTHLVYKPLYGKSAFLNRGLVNNEIYFFAGPGQVNYEWKYSTGKTEEENALSLSMGAGMRFFLSKRFCLNLEVRDLVNFREDQTQNNLYFGLSLGYRFNLAPRKVEEDPTVKKLKIILDED
ncbi:MAG: outer membrane beta-barrel domain-containing protein [Desulfosarcinaceae bacterium]